MLQALDGPETNCYCQCERKAVRSLVLNCAPTTTTTPSLELGTVSKGPDSKAHSLLKCPYFL